MQFSCIYEKKTTLQDDDDDMKNSCNFSEFFFHYIFVAEATNATIWKTFFYYSILCVALSIIFSDCRFSIFLAVVHFGIEDVSHSQNEMHIHEKYILWLIPEMKKYKNMDKIHAEWICAVQ